MNLWLVVSKEPLGQSSRCGKHGKLNETIEVSALWSNTIVIPPMSIGLKSSIFYLKGHNTQHSVHMGQHFSKCKNNRNITWSAN